ncbi:BTB/POZ domain-containing protein KCTD6-like [Asterias amurensis]|uniref:BTB/POZ domain-containing protein KCTD6-like n=1 Tax=Asterias amurensis TaxID=7602 RepID=UPI003AB1C804
MAMENEVIKLDVGGSLYTTSRSTLTRYPNSMLGKMFSGQNSTACDERGRYVIDCDGPIFRYVLNFLRRSTLDLPEGFKEWDLLINEVIFYQIHELIIAVTLLRKQICTIQETEFIEIGFRHNNDLYYLGKQETLKEIPGLNTIIGTQRGVDFFEDSRMLIFQQITSLGFEMVNTTRPWLFKRKL